MGHEREALRLFGAVYSQFVQSVFTIRRHLPIALRKPDHLVKEDDFTAMEVNGFIRQGGEFAMLENIPSQSAMTELLGQSLFNVWQELCSAIEEKYEMERLWNAGGKNWTYEYKYRRGGKTLCSLYAKSNCVGFMIIFGKDEREKFENIRSTLSAAVCRQYDEAKTYHDGKWVMFEPTNAAELDDYIKLLAIKRKPNRKQ